MNWFDYLFYYISFASVTLNFAGYSLILAWLKKFVPPDPIKTSLPGAQLRPESLSIVIPVFNESKFIAEKVKNLVLQRIGGLNVNTLIVDGGSTDGTFELVKSLILEGEYSAFKMQLLKSPNPGKINQLNFALSKIPKGELVLVTDADALINSTDALLRAVQYLQLNSNTAVVGGWTVPPSGSNLANAEHAYWDKQNRMRYLETSVYTSSIVVAPFYMFRSNLVSAFPIDCVADDVFISMRAHQDNLRVIYAHDILVTECRQPGTMGELFRHKLRKAHAYSTELLRILYRLPYMGKRMKFFYMFKLYQFFYLPWALLIYGLATIKLLFFQQDYWTILITLAILFVSTLAGSLIMKPAPTHSRGGLQVQSIISSILVMALMTVVLMVNFFVFPFWKQNSVYRKVTGGINFG